MTVAESRHNSELASVTIQPLQVLICVTDYPIIIDTSGSLSACQFELVSCRQTDSMNWLTQACEEFVLSGSHATKPNSSSLTCLAMLNHDFTVAPAAACSEHSDWLLRIRWYSLLCLISGHFYGHNATCISGLTSQSHSSFIRSKACGFVLNGLPMVYFHQFML